MREHLIAFVTAANNDKSTSNMFVLGDNVGLANQGDPPGSNPSPAILTFGSRGYFQRDQAIFTPNDAAGGSPEILPIAEAVDKWLAAYGYPQK